MRRIRYTEEKETLLDHLISGVLSALAMLLTLAAGPLLAAISGAGRAGKLYLLYGPVHIWGSILLIVSFVVGVVVGPKRMTVLFGHLWATAEPERPRLTFGLWLGIFAVIGIGYWISG